MSTRRLEGEIRNLKKNPPQGFTLNPKIENGKENIMRWEAVLEGPKGTPYEGGHIKIKIIIPEKYPHKEPIFLFDPPCYHISIDQKSGEPSVEILGNWSPTNNLSKVCAELIDLLAYPCPENAVDGDIAHLFEKKRAEYDEKARNWTMMNAK